MYRALSLILLPLLALAAAVRVLRGIDRPADLWQRLRGPRTDAPVIWVHGASLGELNSLRAIIHALGPDPVLVTANTTSGRDAVARWGMAHVQTALAPLDSRSATRPLIRNTRALIIAESELWPNRLALCHSAGIPVALLGARMSQGSARNWARFAPLAARILPPIALIVPQDAGSASRFADLGAGHITPPVMLKSAFAAVTPRSVSDHPTFLAAATHDTEDTVILSAFASARATLPDLRLIIAPRHPERGPAIAALAHDMGLPASLRSKGAAETARYTAVYIADTLGDMDLWYARAGITFIGGSLVDVGGHTPFEPIAYDVPILHGPHVTNFADSYATLATARAAIMVTDAHSLARAITDHINDTAMAARARSALPPVDLTPVIAAVKALL